MDRYDILKKINMVKKSCGGNIKTLPPVYLLHGDLDDAQMNELYNHHKIKAMVSLTHGEGFGRPLLEFATTGKPIMASDWSGQVDFLNKGYTTLYHATRLEFAHSIYEKQFMCLGAKGLFGAGIYFATNPHDTNHKLAIRGVCGVPTVKKIIFESINENTS